MADLNEQIKVKRITPIDFYINAGGTMFLNIIYHNNTTYFSNINRHLFPNITHISNYQIIIIL